MRHAECDAPKCECVEWNRNLPPTRDTMSYGCLKSTVRKTPNKTALGECCYFSYTALFKLSFLVAFMLISILIDCSFHSCCPCVHCFSHRYSVACFASIVVVVPILDTRHWIQSCCLIPAIGRVETSVSHRRSH
jgi:hypothetical protein